MDFKIFNKKQRNGKIIERYHNLIEKEFKKIKDTVIKSSSKESSEDIAEDYFKKLGYDVFRSKVKSGYRIIGIEYYWNIKKYIDKLTDTDKKIIKIIKSVTTPTKFKELAYLFKDKNGCPDLMLIKNNKIKFVEVKTNNEEVKTPTIEFFIKLNNKYPLEILRIKK